MQKTRILPALTAFMLFTTFSIAQKTFELDPFDEINVTGDIEVNLAVGNTEEAVLYTENIPEEEVTIKVSKGVLKIKVIEGVFYKDEKISVNLTFKDLKAIRANAGARITSNSSIEVDELLVRAGSGAQVELRVDLNSLDAGATEGGILMLEGETERQEVMAATGGRFEGFELESQRAYVKANTGGQAEVYAETELEATANTGGSITYKGNPEATSFKSVLSGEVKKL